MFNNISLKMQLLLGFGLVIAVSALGSSITYREFSTVGHEVHNFASVVEDATEASHIEALFLKLRTHAREFAATAEPNDAAAVKDLGKQLAEEIENAVKVEENLDHQKQLREMADDVASFLKDFATAESLTLELRHQIDAEMVPEGEKVTQDLEHVLTSLSADSSESITHAQNALRHALMVRLYSNVMLGHKDEKVEGKLKEEFKALSESLANMSRTAHTDEERALVLEASKLATDYEQVVLKVHKEEIEVRTLVDGEMAQFSKELVNDAERLQKIAAGEEEQIRTETLGNISEAEVMIITIALCAAALGFVVALLIGNKISNPIVAMTNVMHELGKDNLTINVPFGERGDEIGRMSGSIRHFKDQMIRVKQLEAEQEEQKQRAAEQRKLALRKMADSFESSVGKVVETVTSAATELHAASAQMASTAAQTSHRATDVAASAEEASTNVQTVASATEELTSSIIEISRQVAKSAEVAADANSRANETTVTVNSLSDKVDKIGQIIELINDIADQTNLLALNATIEAARAGEAGKGFAVVASEVKNLANQTAKATGEIASQIGEVQHGTAEAVKSISSISAVIENIAEISATVASAVEEQNAATSEIAKNIEQAAQGTSMVSSNIGDVEQASRETGAAAEQINSSSQDLSTQAEYLRKEVGSFLDHVRSDGEKHNIAEWDPSLETGVKSIDDDHRATFDMLNHFYSNMMSGDGGKAAITISRQLSENLTRHFQEEEEHMKRIGYNKLAEHKRVHETLTKNFTELRKAVECNDMASEEKLFTALSEGLINHIRTFDMDFVAAIRKAA